MDLRCRRSFYCQSFVLGVKKDDDHSTPEYNVNHLNTLHLDIYNNNYHLTVPSQSIPHTAPQYVGSNQGSAIKERRGEIGSSLIFFNVGCSELSGVCVCDSLEAEGGECGFNYEVLPLSGGTRAW
jgi:hypothetical protein